MVCRAQRLSLLSASYHVKGHLTCAAYGGQEVMCGELVCVCVQAL